MTFGLSAADMRTSALGAAEGRSTVDEDALKNLWVLQFDGATDASKLLFCEYYDASMIGVNDTTDDDSKKSYSLSVALYETSGDTKIYFVANVGWVASRSSLPGTGCPIRTLRSGRSRLRRSLSPARPPYLPMAFCR